MKIITIQIDAFKECRNSLQVVKVSVIWIFNKTQKNSKPQMKRSTVLRNYSLYISLHSLQSIRVASMMYAVIACLQVNPWPVVIFVYLIPIYKTTFIYERGKVNLLIWHQTKVIWFIIYESQYYLEHDYLKGYKRFLRTT